MITDRIIPGWVDKLDYHLRQKWNSNTLTGLTMVTVKVSVDDVDSELEKFIAAKFYGPCQKTTLSIGRYLSGILDLRSIESVADYDDVIFVSQNVIYTIT